MTLLLELWVLWLAFVRYCCVKPIVIRDIADGLHPAVRKLDGVAAPGHAGVGPLLRPVVVHSAVLVVHSEIVGVRLRLIRGWIFQVRFIGFTVMNCWR